MRIMFEIYEIADKTQKSFSASNQLTLFFNMEKHHMNHTDHNPTQI